MTTDKLRADTSEETKWQNIALGPGQTVDCEPDAPPSQYALHPVQVFYLLSATPDAALLVKRVRVGYEAASYGATTQELSVLQTKLDNDTSWQAFVRRGLHYRLRQEETEHLIQIVQTRPIGETRDHGIVLLLGSLPNLEELELVSQSKQAPSVRSLFEFCRLQDATATEKILGKLRTIGLKHADTEGGEDVCKAAYWLVPSVTRLRGQSIVYYGLSDEHKQLMQGNDITDIEITDGSIEASELALFLQQLPRLRSFKYHEGDAMIGHSFGDDDRISFVNAIKQAVGPTIEELGLSGFYSSYNDNKHCRITSLAGFKKLRWLELDIKSLTDEVDVETEDEELEQGFHTDDTTQEIPRLVNILPPSIETLRLEIGSASQESLDKVFAGFADQAPSKLPRFRSMTYACLTTPTSPQTLQATATMARELARIGVVPAWAGKELRPAHYWKHEDY